jgi:probable rRNA maturation factor
MRLCVDIVQPKHFPLKKAFFLEVIRQTLLVSFANFVSEKKVSVSLAFVRREEITKLNKQYRTKNKVTDILSFPEYLKKKDFLSETSTHIFLGELVLCFDYIADAALEDRVSLEQEMAYIVSHGILHLLGFRHSKQMFALQDIVSEGYSVHKH